jgi:hypothetical protein
MHIIKIDESITLQAIEDGFIVHFGYADQDFYLRPPDTGELDDANTTLRLSRAKFINTYGDILADIPASESDLNAINKAIENAEKRFEEADDGTVAKLRASYQVSTLQRSLEGRMKLDEEADDVAILARDRELALVLLCDDQGNSLYRASDPDTIRRWHMLSIRVKDRARVSIWRILEALENVPFASVPIPDENTD